MAEQRVKRRLAAILAADIVGYSRLMEADETGTLARLKELRAELLHPKVAAYGGRIVKTTGDGTLIEFPSAVDAVQHAVDVQREMARRDAATPQDQRIELRMGINLGDIIIDGDDIYGDGVNIAARLEGLAEPGGICLSSTVYEHVRNKLDAGFEDLGEQAVKNIARPVHVYRVRVDTQSNAAPMRGEALPLPDRPSIAVLPFANMSGDPAQEYFADGIAEDIITALSRFKWLLVIARNSSFTYKSRNVDVRQVGRELGVRYVLEGSVRKGGNRLRITTQLVEAATANHLWAGKYDGVLADVFDLQDKITEGVVGAIAPSVRQAEIERARRKHPKNLDAHDLYLRASPHAWAFTPDDNAKVLELMENALRIDPGYAAARGYAALCYVQQRHWGGPDETGRHEAIRHANAIRDSNTDDAVALSCAGFVFALLGNDFESARSVLDQAVALNPNAAEVLGRSAIVHALMGHVEPAMEHAQHAIRLNPFDPLRCLPISAVSRANFVVGRYDHSAEWAQRAIQANPHFLVSHALLVASYVRLGRHGDAKEAARRAESVHPDIDWSTLAAAAVSRPEDRENLAAALRESGLLE